MIHILIETLKQNPDITTAQELFEYYDYASCSDDTITQEPSYRECELAIKKHHKNINAMRCPMCEAGVMRHHKLESEESVTSHNTHFYACSECPFVGLEYWANTNLKDVYNYLTNQ